MSKELEAKIDKILDFLGLLNERMGTIEDRMSNLETRMDGLEKRFSMLEDKVSRMDHRLGNVEVTLKHLRDEDFHRQREIVDLFSRVEKIENQLIDMQTKH